MKNLFHFLFVLCLGFCIGPIQADVSTKNVYLQHMRAQKFLQIQHEPTKLNENSSVDLDEFDAYEADEESPPPSSFQTNDSIGGTKKKTNREKLEFKDIENRPNNTRTDFLNEEKEKTNLIGGKSCTVNEKGLLNLTINSNDIFNLNKYMVELSSTSIIITQPDNSNNVIKTIPYESIKLPIETIEETNECWKIKTSDNNKMFFCESTKANRDLWVTNILKALFCYNTNTLTVEQNLKNKNNVNVTIPVESTVDKRMNTSK